MQQKNEWAKKLSKKTKKMKNGKNAFYDELKLK
jgi:hypothetical protein